MTRSMRMPADEPPALRRGPGGAIWFRGALQASGPGHSVLPCSLEAVPSPHCLPRPGGWSSWVGPFLAEAPSAAALLQDARFGAPPCADEDSRRHVNSPEASLHSQGASLALPSRRRKGWERTGAGPAGLWSSRTATRARELAEVTLEAG